MQEQIATPAAAGDPGPATVARILYASRACVQGSVYAEMERIRASAVRHNLPVGVHTALLYQSGWFLQWKEGPGDALLRIMDRVGADRRHHSLRVVHSSRGPRLLYGPWSMAIVQAAEDPADMDRRIAQLNRGMDAGMQASPPAVWRHLSTPMRHPGASQQADPEAFQRVLACAASGTGSFELVRHLAALHGQDVVQRRFAGAQDLDVGTDLVDFEQDGRVLRVIAMARKGLLLPLTRAFLPDYSHVLLLLSGHTETDLGLLLKVAGACAGLATPPALVGIAPDATAHAEPFALAHRLGLVYLQAEAPPDDVRAAWRAAEPLLAMWRAAAGRGLAIEAPRRALAA